MIKGDRVINEMLYGDIVEKVSKTRNVGISEARKIVSGMSFIEYNKLAEASADIAPPSGQTISPTAGTNTAPGATPTSAAPKTWAGKGTPLEPGMTVGLKGQGGTPIPGQVSAVELAKGGVQVKNPTTGQDEWMNIDDLQPFMAQGGPTQQQGQAQPGQPQAPGATQPTQEEAELNRMKQLAGIGENCSGGATGAGAVAIAPASLGGMQRRQKTNEQPRKEYTPDGPAKTIVGDTKPHQASGALSSNLAMRGKRTATRTNNGFKR